MPVCFLYFVDSCTAWTSNTRIERWAVERNLAVVMPSTEDYLLRADRQFADYRKANGAGVTYEEGPGRHDWDSWDSYIQRVLDWLQLQGRT